MFIREIIVDGFKSYATRTVIAGFDPHFNAITGRNGSGKSNILDSICFVLGISNLTQVRVSNLQELVYKQGQAGVTKASVSIVFDNSDRKQSPVGYEQYEQVTVTRQVVIGGRSKYLMNGHQVQPGRVHNFFHSVQLNVNNPHFLIMQGRITHVLNMNAKETLSMIEEAAGTRMFETKKQAALKTIEKKQVKVDEINKVLTEEITPSLDKLHQQQKKYHRYAAITLEVERLKRYCVAHDFVELERQQSKAAGDKASLQEQFEAASKAAAEYRASAEEAAGKIEALAETRRSQLEGEGGFKAGQAKEEALAKALVQANSVHQNKVASLDEERRSADGVAKSLAATEKAIAKLEATLSAKQEQAKACVAEAEAATEQLAMMQRQLQAVSAGMQAGEDGEERTLADRLVAAQREASEASTEAKAQEMRLASLAKSAKEAAKELAAAAKEHAKLKDELSAATAASDAVSREIDASAFSPEEEKVLVARQDALQTRVAELTDACDALSAHMSARFELDYDEAAVGKALGDAPAGRGKGKARGGAGAGAGAGSGSGPMSRVKGFVGSLVSVKDKAAATALEVAAGGKLYQLVVDTEATGKALLSAGRLKRRVTIIPLNKVRRGTMPEGKVTKAEHVSGGRARTALSLVGYDDDVAAAMEYVFGRTLVCDDPEAAKLVTFNKAIAAPSVTLDGDSFDPAGTLEGGSRPGDGTSILLKLHELREAREARDAAAAELADVEAALAAMAKAAERHSALASQLELKQHQAAILQKRVDDSKYASLATRRAELAEQITAVTNEVKAFKAKAKAAEARVTELKAEVADGEAKRRAAIADTEKAIAKAKANASKATAKARALEQGTEETVLEIEAANKEAASLREQVAAISAAVDVMAADVATEFAKLQGVRAQYDEAKAALDGQRASLADCDKQLARMQRERDDALKRANDSDLNARKHEHRLQRQHRDAAGVEAAIAEMLAANEWIAKNKHLFDNPHSDYYCGGRDAKKDRADLRAASAEQAALSKSVNKKVAGMIESVEKEYQDLMSKRRIIENDKSKIHRVIKELDVKKNEALHTTWQKVNRDFGSIFATLLPGTSGKLVPPEGGTVLDGLEVRVAFGGVWKESLSELSGGQRSLLALSLILALLLFKPAPMYILDEVDAALDLSHTQNIGTMLRTHFSHSQFIVVSLKQGMFNNANVVFKTKFVDGVSTVTRTVGGGGRGTASGAAIEDAEEGHVAGKGKGKGKAGGRAKVARTTSAEATA